MSRRTSGVGGHRPGRHGGGLAALRGGLLAVLFGLGAGGLGLPAAAQDDTPAVSPEESAVQIEVAQVVLAGLGMYQGEATGSIDAPMREALKAFQTEVGLEATGILDLETSDALIQLAELAAGADAEGEEPAEEALAGEAGLADDEVISEEEALLLEQELLEQGLLDAGGSLLEEDFLLEDEEETLALEEELAQLSPEELAELTEALGVECRGYNLETEAPVVGSCVDGVFEGEDELTGSLVAGKCQPSGDLDARDEDSGEPVYGTCN